MVQEAPSLKKYVNMKCQRVNDDESFVPALEDEAIEVEHLLAEPKNDNVSVDGVLSLKKCLDIEDIPGRFECGLESHSGGMDSNTTREGEDELKLGVFDGMLHEVAEVGDLHATNSLSGACEDYLLDIEFAETVSELDNGPCAGSHLGNSSSESHSPGFSGSDNGAVGISESSTGTIPVPECGNNLDKMTICTLHGTSRSKCECKMLVEGKMELQGSASFNLQNPDGVDNVSNLVSGIPLVENRKDVTFTNLQYNKASSIGQGMKKESFAGRKGSRKRSVEASDVGMLLSEKRMRRPTRRYIEEFSDLKSKSNRGRPKNSTTTTKNKLLGNRHRSETHHKGFSAAPLVPSGSYGRSSDRTPFEVGVQKGCLKKYASISDLDSDEESSPAESEDDCMTIKRPETSGDRRKHQRLWTLSEVMKLVDGVSHYGVGRWTDIKRLLFSSSAYRTPVDLRDKWRNLLRASCAQLQSKREVEQKRKHAMRPLPQTLLHRVSELAIIHPYPKGSNSKLPHVGHVTSAVLPTTSKDAPSSLGRRLVPRKNCT